MRQTGSDAHVLISLVNDTFVPRWLDHRDALVGDPGVVVGPSAAVGAEARGWAAEVTSALRRDVDLHLVDNTALRLALPQVARVRRGSAGVCIPEEWRGGRERE